MKWSSLLYLILAIMFISSGCKNEDCDTMKKTEFTGTSTWVKDISPGTTEVLESGKILITGQKSEWYDSANIAQVTGQSFWVVNQVMSADFSGSELWGTAVINVGVKNEGDPVLGKWEIIWDGTLTDVVIDPESGSIIGGKIKANACGVGVSGNVENMTGHWIYIMDLAQGPIYYSTGYIK